MHGERPEFWIDVGGTFTDCLARLPNGSLERHKLLSSGVTKGRVGEGSTATALVDPVRADDPRDFWVGWRVSILDAQGHEIDRAEVVGFDSAGKLLLTGLAQSPAPNSGYELSCELEAPVVAIRYMLAIPLAQPVPSISLRLGTTRGTNALITRSGARTALVTTRGFGDVLEIGYQARPRLFDLTIRKPPTLTSAVIEIDERMTHDGEVLTKLQTETIRQQLQTLRDLSVESLAVCLLHADRHSAHERLIECAARDVGFREISLSHVVAPLPKLVPRADTTVVDAYLNPVLRDYVERLGAALPGSQIRLLTSAGGLVAGEHFCGKDSVLSGPAGGVVGFSRVAQAAGFERAIGFDMGGTSTDVSRFDGRFELEYETQKAGVRLVAPTMAIETVAAGGGSICRFDGVKFTVGPESAGADPGPACYGRGGPLTVTDVNYFLGRLVAERFPFPLDKDAARQRLQELAVESANASAGGSLDTVTDTQQTEKRLDEVAAGLLRIANAKMAAAIRLVTVAKGANPSEYVLVAFGGAAGQHACAIARELGIRQVLCHPQAGVLSALGIGLADVMRHRSCGIERPLDAHSVAWASGKLDTLQQDAEEELAREGVRAEQMVAKRSLDVRYRGIDSSLTIEWPSDDNFSASFAEAHRKRYGYVHQSRPLEILAARIEVVGRVAAQLPSSARVPGRTAVASRAVIAYFDGARRNVPLFDRGDLTAGEQIEGPAIITEDIATTVVDPGWVAEVLSGGELLLVDVAEPKFDQAATASVHGTSAADPVLLEIFNNHLASIAEQMGVTLRNTASSINVKERLDFSCAIFTADGRLVANAPHVPVHLGAMEETVRSTIAAHPLMRPGDVFATNDPYAGGSHLPDITVISPVYNRATGQLMFFTANRAHHAEIGGMAPGSMPPLSKNLAQEGVLIRNMKIVSGGDSQLDALRDVLLSGKYPTRDVATNLADIDAQIAANQQGAADLAELVRRYSWPLVATYMDLFQDAAEHKVRLALARLPVGEHKFTDFLESANGASIPITVNFVVHGDPLAPREDRVSRSETNTMATIDFTGTGPVIDGNLNANRAIVTAAVTYVLRLLLNEDIPLNHGVLRPIEIVLPTGILNPPAGPTPETTPAVAGGNVETSQRIVDVLLGALGIAGASQGTMNNVIFGDDTFGYYETICGGSGATSEGPGASAVQVHMTNTRLTDPEVLERRFPVRVREFAIRPDSGGNGQRRGGDGVVRQLEFLRPLTLSLLTQRRGTHPPYGAAGGAPGAIGRNWLMRADGTRVELSGITQIQVAAGDVLTIETPGGGGYGAATKR